MNKETKNIYSPYYFKNISRTNDKKEIKNIILFDKNNQFENFCGHGLKMNRYYVNKNFSYDYKIKNKAIINID